MKRLIKYWNRYESDKSSFSDCSSGYELLPEVVSDDAGNDELRALAKKYRIKLEGNAQKIEAKQGWGRRELTVTNAIRTNKTFTWKFHGKNEPMPVWIGFITIPSGGPLEIKATLDNPVTKKDAREIVSCQAYGIDDVGEDTQGNTVIVMAGWHYFHALRFAGYSLESFRKLMGATKDEGEHFEDSVFRCSACGVYDDRDTGYTYNYRIVDGEQLGLNCGCYETHMERPDALEVYADDESKAIERAVMLKHEKAGRVKEIATYIGGMTDPGRGGYIRGKSVNNGDPESVLADLKSEFPEKRFVFSHDESGQFQTYFSVWEILPEPEAKKTKAKKAPEGKHHG